MKRKKILIGLLLIFAGLCAFIGIEKTAVRHVEKINTVDKEIISLSSEQVTEISWTNENKTLSFIKSKDQAVWQDKEDAQFPVSQEKFKTFLEKFESVHASFIIEDVKDYAQYGLEHPAATMEIVCGEEKQRISFGDFSTMDAKRYVKTVDGTVYLIDDDLVKYMSPNRDDYMASDELYNYSTVKAVSIRVRENVSDDIKELKIQYLPDEVHSYDETIMHYLIDGAEYRAVDERRLKNWLQKLTDSELKSYETYTFSEEELKKYGLDRPTFELTVSGEMEESKESLKTPESYKVVLSKTGNKEYYLRVDKSKIIYKIEQGLYDDLCSINYNSIRPVSIFNQDWEKVSSLIVETGENAHTITQDRKDTYYLGENTVELNDAIDKIKKLNITDFEMKDMETQVNNALTAKPEISLAFKLDMGEYPELKVDFYNLSGAYSIARMNGETLGLVKRHNVTEVREALICAILDKKLTL